MSIEIIKSYFRFGDSTNNEVPTPEGGERRFDRVIQFAAWSFSALLFATFTLIALARVFSEGVCCADDAYYAVVAKNLVKGLGYAASVQGGKTVLFDPTSGSGPVLILPAAFAMTIFGNRYWIPGLSLVIMWSSMLLVLYWRIYKEFSSALAPVAASLFIIVTYALFPMHHEHWYALLGEVPAALLVLVGFVTWAGDPLDGRRLPISAVLLSLAFLTKILTALSVVVFLMVAVFYYLFIAKSSLKTLAGKLLTWSVYFLIPLLLFEAWKLGALGIDAYIANIKGFISFMRNQGLAGKSSVGFVERAISYSIACKSRLGISPFEIILLSLVAVIVMQYSRDVRLRVISMLLFLYTLFAVLYFLFFSIGWPRYILIALIVFIFLISILPLAIKSVAAKIAFATILIFIAANINYNILGIPTGSMDNGWFKQSTPLRNLISVSQFVDNNRVEHSMVSEWSGTCADIEYMSSGAEVFGDYKQVPLDKGNRNTMLSINTRFYQENRDFQRLTDSCESPVVSLPPYLVYHCR